MEEHGDVAFAPQKTTYKSILYKTYFVLELAVTAYDAAYVLKTDDDAYVDSGNMVAALRALCKNPNCTDERCDL